MKDGLNYREINSCFSSQANRKDEKATQISAVSSANQLHRSLPICDVNGIQL